MAAEMKCGLLEQYKKLSFYNHTRVSVIETFLSLTAFIRESMETVFSVLQSFICCVFVSFLCYLFRRDLRSQ